MEDDDSIYADLFDAKDATTLVGLVAHAHALVGVPPSQTWRLLAGQGGAAGAAERGCKLAGCRSKSERHCTISHSPLAHAAAART
jgi:hypothetical protein